MWFSFVKITNHTQLEEKLGGDDNFQAWKYRISLILEENDLDQFITREVPEPEGDEDKDAHKRSMAKAKIIIADYIKDHLIPHVSSFMTTKEVYDALTKMFEGKNLNQKMTSRNQLKTVKIQNYEMIQRLNSQGFFKSKNNLKKLKRMSKKEKF